MADQHLSEPQDQDQHDASTPPEGVERTLSDEIVSLIEDGKTYFDAEIAYQKSRAALAAQSGKHGIVFVFAALALLHLALIALVVGLVIALAPLVTAWGALGIVVGVLLLGVIIFGLLAMARFKRIAAVVKKDASDE